MNFDPVSQFLTAQQEFGQGLATVGEDLRRQRLADEAEVLALSAPWNPDVLAAKREYETLGFTPEQVSAYDAAAKAAPNEVTTSRGRVYKRSNTPSPMAIALADQFRDNATRKAVAQMNVAGRADVADARITADKENLDTKLKAAEKLERLRQDGADRRLWARINANKGSPVVQRYTLALKALMSIGETQRSLAAAGQGSKDAVSAFEELEKARDALVTLHNQAGDDDVAFAQLLGEGAGTTISRKDGVTTVTPPQSAAPRKPASTGTRGSPKVGDTKTSASGRPMRYVGPGKGINGWEYVR